MFTGSCARVRPKRQESKEHRQVGHYHCMVFWRRDGMVERRFRAWFEDRLNLRKRKDNVLNRNQRRISPVALWSRSLASSRCEDLVSYASLRTEFHSRKIDLW